MRILEVIRLTWDAIREKAKPYEHFDPTCPDCTIGNRNCWEHFGKYIERPPAPPAPPPRR